MGKKIIDKKVHNPRNLDELATLYLYETLAKLEEEINLEDVLSLFNNAYENTDIPEVKYKYLLDTIKKRLHNLRLREFGHKIDRYGYQSSELNVPSKTKLK